MRNKTFSDLFEPILKRKVEHYGDTLAARYSAAEEAAERYAHSCVEKAGVNNAIKFTEWVFSECSMDAGHFPHELGFWHKETQKYLSLIDLYDLFENLPKPPKP